MNSSKLSIDGPTSDIDFYSSENDKYSCHMTVFEQLLNFQKISIDSEKKQKFQNIFLQFNSDVVRFILRNSYNIFNGDDFELDLSCINYYHVLRIIHYIKSNFECSEQFKKIKNIVMKQLINNDKEWYKIFHNDRFNHDCFNQLRDLYLTIYYKDNDTLKMSEQDVFNMPSSKTQLFLSRVLLRKKEYQHKREISKERRQAQEKEKRNKAYINKLERAIQRTNNSVDQLTTTEQHAGWGHYYNFYTSHSVNRLRQSARDANSILAKRKKHLTQS